MPKYKKLTREMFGDSINWEVWDRVVEKTKREIAEMLKNYKSVPNHGIGCYAYDCNGNLYNFYVTIRELKKDITGACESTISRYVKAKEIYNGYLLSTVELPKDKAKELYNERLTTGKCYFPNQTVNAKHRKRVYTYNSDGKLVGCFDSITIFRDNGGIWFKEDRLHNNKLISKSFYNEDTAKKIYKNLYWGKILLKSHD